MTDVRNQQAETAVLMDAGTAFGADLEVPYMDDGPSDESHTAVSLEVPDMDDDSSVETWNSSEELAVSESNESTSVLSCYYIASTHSASESNESNPAILLRILAIFSCCSSDNKLETVPSVAGNFAASIEEYIPGLRRYAKNILGKELQEDEEHNYRHLFLLWNIFLQSVQGIPGASVIISSDIKEDMDMFITWLELLGLQLTKTWIKAWLPDWNMFLQLRTGKKLVTRWNVFLTIVGFIFYLVDQVSDIGTSAYYAGNGQWWRAIVTLTIVYGAVIIHTISKWISGQIHCTGAADWLRYVASLLVNWPDLELYWAHCRVEWQLHKSPASSAHLIPEWHERRYNVSYLKYSEGVWEACPQAILQLCLLVPDLYGHWTWTDYLRIAGASVSLCTAGAALVNDEKYRRIMCHIDLSLSELVVLHVWAVPVTVCRLLSVALILSVHLYWALAGVALHLVLRGVNWWTTVRVSRTLNDVISMCVDTLQFCLSPFIVGGSVTYGRVSHAIHFLGNTAMIVVWALGTPLLCTHPALYTAIICFNAVMFAVGLVGWQLHQKHWPGSYL